MKLRVSRVHFPVTVLGPGRRLGIWVQGCSIKCHGCVSRDTWDRNGGQLIDVNELVQDCRRITAGQIDGVTITGGEPFEQPDALAALLDALEGWRTAKRFDVLCYSGFPLKQLEREHATLFARLDALIPEPFVEERPIPGAWRGSDNQPLIAPSKLGRERYSTFPIKAPSIQVVVTDNPIWFIGIPRRGDMDRLQVLVKQYGLELEDASWRT